MSEDVICCVDPPAGLVVDGFLTASIISIMFGRWLEVTWSRCRDRRGGSPHGCDLRRGPGGGHHPGGGGGACSGRHGDPQDTIGLMYLLTGLWTLPSLPLLGLLRCSLLCPRWTQGPVRELPAELPGALREPGDRGRGVGPRAKAHQVSSSQPT